MTTVHRLPLRSALALFLGALLAAAMILLAPPAQAHDTLLESSPADGEQVETLPEELVLTFSAALIDGEGATRIEVVGPDGDVVADDAVVEGPEVTVPLAEYAASGNYQVTWRVVSSDGHPIGGEFGFEVLTATLAPEPEPEPEVTTPESTEEPEVAPSEEPGAAEESEQPADAETDDRNFFSPLVLTMIVLAVGFVAVLGFVGFRGRKPRSGASDS